MLDLDIIKKKVVYSRTTQTTYSSVVVEFPIGLGEAVSLLAVHWHLESAKNQTGDALFIAALSENPEHELDPPAGVAELQGNLSLYGMATWAHHIAIVTAGADYGYAWEDSVHTLIIPLYGILRPKRQIAVFANVWHTGLTGIRGEIYYMAMSTPTDIVNAMNRRYGKYRRT